jgi:hypothetical protein
MAGQLWAVAAEGGFIYWRSRSQYIDVLMYSDVRRCIWVDEYSAGGADGHALQQVAHFGF